MARLKGGIETGSAFESTAEVPLHANGNYETTADRLAPAQLRHPSWLVYDKEVGSHFSIKRFSECTRADGSTAVTHDEWGTLPQHWQPLGGAVDSAALIADNATATTTTWSSTKIAAQISAVVTGSVFKGTWNALNNQPVIGTAPQAGWFYIVSVAGTTPLPTEGGATIKAWPVGSAAIYNGTNWYQLAAAQQGLVGTKTVDLSGLVDGMSLYYNGATGKFAVRQFERNRWKGEFAPGTPTGIVAGDAYTSAGQVWEAKVSTTTSAAPAENATWTARTLATGEGDTGGLDPAQVRDVVAQAFNGGSNTIGFNYDPEDTETPFYPYLRSSSVFPYHLHPSLLALFPTAEQAAAVATLFRNGTTIYLTPDTINTVPSNTDVVVFTRPLPPGTWILRDGVTYYTGNIPHKISLVTDGGNTVRCSVLGGSQYVNTKRYASFTGFNTNVTLEMDFYNQGDGGSTSLTAGNNAQVTLRGLFNAQGGVGIRASDTARVYFSGLVRSGGGHIVWASENAFVEVRSATMNEPYGYLSAFRAEGNSEIVHYGGATNETGDGYALTFAAVVVNNATIRLRSGRYSNAGGRPALSLENNGKIYVSSGVVVTTPGLTVYGPATATVFLHEGAELVGSAGNGVTITELPADSEEQGGGGDPNADDTIAPLFNPATGDLSIRTADGETYTVNIRDKARLVATFPAGVAGYMNELRIFRPSMVGSYLLESISGMISGHTYKVNGVDVSSITNLQMNDVVQIIGQAQGGGAGTIVLIQA